MAKQSISLADVMKMKQAGGKKSVPLSEVVKGGGSEDPQADFKARSAGMTHEQRVEAYRATKPGDPWGDFLAEEIQKPQGGETPEQAADRAAIGKPASGMRPSKNEIGPWTSALLGAGDAATLGFLDEVSAGAEAAISDSTYEDALARNRQVQDLSYEQHPVAYTAGQLGTAVLTPGGAAKGAGVVARVGRGLLEGAGYGAAYGFGSSDGDLGDRAVDGVFGGLTGGVLGGAVPAVGAAVRGTARTVTGLANAIRKPAETADNMVADAIRADRTAASTRRGGAQPHLDLNEVQAAKSRPATQDVVVGDLGGEKTTRLARTAANISTDAGDELRHVTGQRYREQGDRVVTNLDSLYPDGLNSPKLLDRFKRLYEASTKPLYDAAYNAPKAQTIWTNKISNLMAAPEMQRAVLNAESRSATRAAATGGKPIKNPFVKDANGNLTLNNAQTGATPSLAFWDVVKRNLDDEINDLLRNGKKDLARDVITVRDELRNHLDQIVPQYQRARGVAANFFKANDAHEAGQMFARQTAEGDVSRAISKLGKMSGTERELFERGFMSEYVGRLSNKNDSTDIARALFGSPLDRKKLDFAVSPARRKQVEAVAKVETVMNRLHKAVSGNSTTVQQLLDVGAATGVGAVGGWATTGDPLSGAALLGVGRAGGKYVSNIAQQKVMAEVGRILASGVPADIQRVQQLATQSPQVMRALDKWIDVLGDKGSKAITRGSVIGVSNSDEDNPQNFDKGGIARKLVGAAEHIIDGTKKRAGVIDDWQWRPEEEVAAELGLSGQEMPGHVQEFGRFMKEQSDKAGTKGLSKRDLVKAYTITRSSIQRGAVDADKLRAAGFDIPGATGGVRPEGAFSEWLLTPTGKRYLDNAEKGIVDEDAIADAKAKMAPFGKHETDLPDFMRNAVTGLDGKEAATSDLVARAARGESTPQEWRDANAGLRGIGPSKKGFYASLLGRGDQPTLDARQITLNTGKPTKEASKYIARQGGKGGEAAVDRLAERQRNLDMKLPAELDPYYQHLGHHTIWDKTAGEVTTHEDLMRAMRYAAMAGTAPVGLAAALDGEDAPAATEEQGFAKGGLAQLAEAAGGVPMNDGGGKRAIAAKLLRVAMPDILARSGLPSSGKEGERAARRIASTLGLSPKQSNPLEWNYEYEDLGYVQRPSGVFDFDKAVQDKATFMLLPGDTTPAGRRLVSVNDKPLKGGGVHQQGGADFVYSPGSREAVDPQIWASLPGIAKGTATHAKDIPGDGPVIGAHMTMVPGKSGDFSHMNIGTALGLHDFTQLPEETGNAFDALVNAARKPNSPVPYSGIRSEAFPEEIMRRAEGTGTLRQLVMEKMDSEEMRKAGMPELGALRFANTDPHFLTGGTGMTGHSVANMDRSGRTLTGVNTEHETYTNKILGTPANPFPEQIPASLLLRDFLIKERGYKPEDLPDLKLSSPDIRALKMNRKAYQPATIEWRDPILRYIDEVQSGKRPRRNLYR